jgi:4'-phosphopantetheinyl transferase
MADQNSQHRIDVWFVNLDAAADSSCEGLLSPDELERAARFHSPVHRRRFVTGRAALRLLLAERAGCDPGILRFRYGPFGKPELDANHADLRFNVSHADGRAVIAVCVSAQVGVDVEPCRPVTDRDGVAKIVFSDDELRELAGAADKDRAFLNGWTRKEAYNKALGTGFSEPLQEFTVSLGEKAALLAPGAGAGGLSDWTLMDVHDAGHVVALAARARNAAVDVHPDFSPGGHVCA